MFPSSVSAPCHRTTKRSTVGEPFLFQAILCTDSFHVGAVVYGIFSGQPTPEHTDWHWERLAAARRAQGQKFQRGFFSSIKSNRHANRSVHPPRLHEARARTEPHQEKVVVPVLSAPSNRYGREASPEHRRTAR